MQLVLPCSYGTWQTCWYYGLYKQLCCNAVVESTNHLFDQVYNATGICSFVAMWRRNLIIMHISWATWEGVTYIQLWCHVTTEYTYIFFSFCFFKCSIWAIISTASMCSYTIMIFFLTNHLSKYLVLSTYAAILIRYFKKISHSYSSTSPFANIYS